MYVAEAVYSKLLQTSNTCDSAARDANSYQWYLGRAAHDNDRQSVAAGAAAAGGGEGQRAGLITVKALSELAFKRGRQQ
jgi:hypothetical protein